MAFQFKPLSIPDVILIQPDIYGDDRGFFREVFKASQFKDIGINQIVQVNHSKSQKNVLRGLHFQIEPKAQGKIVSVVAGKIFDVAVDVRKNSSTFGQWVSVELSAEEKNMVYVPEGFAHGFYVMEDETEIVYYCAHNEYSAEHERGIIWNDADINIQWPAQNPILSAKDQQAGALKDL
jgi:dTDP-4-dehydrorhamnose 3,5-epimerase